MRKRAFLAGTILALTAVMLGAFGAHALKEILTPDQIKSFETGVRYQMYHALILVIFGFKGHAFHIYFETAIITLFTIGVVLFSFSIYLLNLQDYFGWNLPWLGPVTPLGGSLLIVAWTLLLVDAIRVFTKKAK